MPEQYRLRCRSRVRLPRLLHPDGIVTRLGVSAMEQTIRLGARGDMAAAHSGWALDRTAERNSECCFYCPLSKKQ
eukprot:3997158-Pleurochrysis_carterae.AAC.2